MDRKTLTGFILIGAILLLWPKYSELISPSEKTPENPVLPDTTIVEKYSELSQEFPKKTQGVQRDIQSKTLTVDGGSYVAKINNIAGGSLVSFGLKKHLKGLNKKMKEAASNLEFEEAAKIRDEIRKLETTELEITLNPKIRQYDVKNKLYPKGRSTMGMPGTKVTKKRDKKWKHKR